MLDLVKGETERIDSRFLEPACGDGNFLSEILLRKLGEPSTEPRKEIVQPQSEISKPSQQSSFVPARPSYTPPATPIDVSDIRPGSIVWHKAFGQGSVITIEPEKGTILVKFEGKNRLFQFPGSFLQGFLSKEKYGNQ
jgi:hypothetical protein